MQHLAPSDHPAIAALDDLPDAYAYGRVTSILGMTAEVGGLRTGLSLGDRLLLERRNGSAVTCEVVGFQRGRALVMPFGDLDGVGLGCRADLVPGAATVRPSAGWLGRVVNALGEPLDGSGPLPLGRVPMPLKASPPPAHSRAKVEGKLDLGIRAINTFLTCCRGQRMGIFAGSGVGKSMLLAMLARFATADVNIIGLIGERGREVQEFIRETLGPEGLAKSVIVVATGDEAPLARRQAAYMTLALAEYFRDQGKNVLCMIDSVTRFAMAQREIGLSAGEPPATKGYTPSAFSELPRLLERAGPGPGCGTITGLFTVLVEGGDHDEPVADAVRGILDGHIVLDRRIAERGRYPAIDVLRSVSRTLPGCNADDENDLLRRARRLLSAYNDMAEMIRLGAYRAGSDPLVDEAVARHDELEGFLSQRPGEHTTLEEGYARLSSLLERPL